MFFVVIGRNSGVCIAWCLILEPAIVSIGLLDYKIILRASWHIINYLKGTIYICGLCSNIMLILGRNKCILMELLVGGSVFIMPDLTVIGSINLSLNVIVRPLSVFWVPCIRAVLLGKAKFVVVLSISACCIISQVRAFHRDPLASFMDEAKFVNEVCAAFSLSKSWNEALNSVSFKGCSLYVRNLIKWHCNATQ